MADETHNEIEMVVESVRVHMLSSRHVVILKQADRDRYLPIWIGPWEASAIAMRLQGLTPERPLTHDLFATVLGALGARVDRVLISSLADETFHARLVVVQPDARHEIDARPSDAIALAVRLGAPIYAAEEVLDRAALGHVVFADPDNTTARDLQADTLEQLGYQAENGTWRNFYLSAARELRDGVVVMPTPSTATPDAVAAMSVEMFLDFLAIRLNGPKAADRAYTFDLRLTDLGRTFLIEVEHGVLNYTEGATAESPTAALTLERAAIDRLASGQATFADLVADGSIVVEGETSALVDFFGLLDSFEFWFNIATP